MKELELTLEEFEARYPEEWVLIQETDWDDQGNPTKGLMVAHHVNRANLSQNARYLHMKQPGVKTFMFFTGPKIPDGLVVVL
ncbi:MAG: hypothetical protein ACOC6B_06325 [Thermodesulfobacteriota bacterium]